MEGHSGIRSEGSQQLFNRNYAGHVYTCGGGAYGLMGKYKKRMDTLYGDYRDLHLWGDGRSRKSSAAHYELGKEEQEGREIGSA